MKADEIIGQWIKEDSIISFWGQSDTSLREIRKFIRRYGKFNAGYIYDSYPSKTFVSVSDIKFEIRDGDQYDTQDTKLILCVTKRQSCYEVIKKIEKLNAVYRKDYIDIYECDISGTKENPYEKITPYATYAPWREDEEFVSLYEKIRKNTLVDIYRLYSLWISCKESAKCSGGGDIAEIGVWRGGSGALLCYAMRKYSSQETGKVYLCDTFQGVPKTGDEDIYKGGEHSDTDFCIVQDLLNRCGLENAEIVTGIFPDDCYGKFEEKTFRLVHIDVDAYQSARDVFNFVWDKVVTGGFVIFDDYGFEATVGVTKLCKELENNILDGRCIFHLNGQAIFIKCGHDV